MLLLHETIAAVRDFLETGGDVLWLILAVTFVMWTLILERFWYAYFVYPGQAREITRQWEERRDRNSWHAHRVREMLISRIDERLRRSVGIVKTFVAVCPLLGLLGTVTGMIEVFDVMAIEGSGNARAMASGVSKATIPTMAGMVAALSGLYFSARLERLADTETEKVGDHLTRA